jgi:glycosyltransferase involved in cell wall biosynthesis
LRIAAAVVIPGKVGLAVNHAFAHGVPVITRLSDLHAPEVEYIRPGHNGLIVPGDLDAFVDRVRCFVRSATERTRLAEGALRTREELTLTAMVRAFDGGVARALGLEVAPREPPPRSATESSTPRGDA